jgi:hypothetical protein
MTADPDTRLHTIRECGPCTACCTVFAVSELEKGMFEACSHVCDAGCAIYPDRPEPCRAFRCQWLRGMLEVDGSVDRRLRPDACGVIVDFQPQTENGDMFAAWEVHPGASDEEPARSVLQGLQEQFRVMINSLGPAGGPAMVQRRFVGPTCREEPAQQEIVPRRAP